MYLKIVNISTLFGIMEVFVGPFFSEKERSDFKEAWIKVLGCPGAIIVNCKKLPKNKNVIPVQYAKLVLELCRRFKD